MTKDVETVPMDEGFFVSFVEHNNPTLKPLAIAIDISVGGVPDGIRWYVDLEEAIQALGTIGAESKERLTSIRDAFRKAADYIDTILPEARPMSEAFPSGVSNRANY